MSPEFHAGERDHVIHLECTECGRPAEGNAEWTDGSGDICDACVSDQESHPTRGRPTVGTDCDGSCA